MSAKCVPCGAGLLRWAENQGSAVRVLQSPFVEPACVDRPGGTSRVCSKESQVDLTDFF